MNRGFEGVEQSAHNGRQGLGTKRSPLFTEIWSHRASLQTVARYAIASGVIGSASWLYTMQVYDRVVTTRSLTTLLTLTGLVLFAYVMLEVIEWVRNEVLRAVAKELDTSLSERVFDLVFRGALTRNQQVSPTAMQDLREVTQFFYSPNMGLLVDMPVALLNLAVIMLINPVMGAWSIMGAVIQGYLTFRTQQSSMDGMKKAQEQSMMANRYAGLALSNAEAIQAMGMTERVRSSWKRRQDRYMQLMVEASTVSGQKAALSKTIQFAQSSLILGLGCYLTIKGVLGGEKSAIGAPGPVLMLIASILGGRGIGPLVQMIMQWQVMAQTWQAYQRLDRSLLALPPQAPAMSLPDPVGRVSVERLFAKAPGSDVMTIKGVHAEIPPGSLVVVIGPSAAGKSSLAKCLVGVWEADAGSVRLDGASIARWPKEQLGRHIGYLPQSVELFEGSVADNICRFTDHDLQALQQAVDIAGVSELIAKLQEGMHTAVGADGHFLSGGQRQRVGLARAVYGLPKLVVLDEPDAHLDRAGDAALRETCIKLKAHGSTCVIISHRKELLEIADLLLVMHEGQMAAFGPKEQVLRALEASKRAQVTQVVAEASPRDRQA